MKKDYFEELKKHIEENPERKKDRLITTNLDTIKNILIEQNIVSKEQYKKILNQKEIKYDQLIDKKIKKELKDFENSGSDDFLDYIFQSMIKSK